MRLVLHPKVYSDIDEIMGYYERVATPGLAEEFYTELRYFMTKAADKPESFSIVRLQRENCIFVDHGRPPARVSRHLIHREWFGLARGYAYRCRRTIAIAAIMPKGIRMKSAMRMPIAKPFASGERPGGTATNRVSQSSSFMVPSELRIQYTDIAAVTD